VREDEQFVKELRNKVDFSSKLTILEFTNRKKRGKDPHYSKPLENPAES